MSIFVPEKPGFRGIMQYLYPFCKILGNVTDKNRKKQLNYGKRGYEKVGKLLSMV